MSFVLSGASPTWHKPTGDQIDYRQNREKMGLATGYLLETVTCCTKARIKVE